jgi:hypothetical protein
MTVGTAVSGIGSTRICARPWFAQANAHRKRKQKNLFFIFWWLEVESSCADIALRRLTVNQPQHFTIGILILQRRGQSG